MTDHLTAIRREADAFLAAARRGLEPRVPGCPEWTVRELTHHLGYDYLWHARHIVRGRADEPAETEPELPPDDQLLAWFDGCCNEVIAALRSTDPDLPAWNWAPHTPQVVGWWPRRLAVETAVHRWDAQSAHAAAVPLDLELALDAIEEMVTVIGPAHTKPGFPTGVLAIRPSDSPRRWAVRLAPDTFEVLTTEPAAPDAVVQGPASDLALAFWGREAEYRAEGDPALVAVMT